MQATIDQQKPNPKHYFHCLLCDKKFDTSHNLANHEKKIHDVGVSPNQSQQTAEIVHRSESDDEFSWDDIKDQKNNSNLPSAPLEEVQDVTEIDVDSPDIEFNKENAQRLMNTFSEVYSKEEKTEIYDSYVTSSITVSKKNSINFFQIFAMGMSPKLKVPAQYSSLHTVYSPSIILYYWDSLAQKRILLL